MKRERRDEAGEINKAGEKGGEKGRGRRKERGQRHSVCKIGRAHV